MLEGNGQPFTLNWFGRLTKLVTAVNQLIAGSNAGFTGTITTAKLTGGGTNGSMTFQNGTLVAEVAAT